MSILELVPLTLPAVVIIGVAIALAAGGRRRGDVVLDLRDVPAVERSALTGAGPSPAVRRPVGGALVEPSGTGTLGARIRSVEGPVQPAVAVPTRTRSVVLRRRQRPLVAVSRETPTR